MDPERAKRFSDGYFIIQDEAGRVLGRSDGQPLTPHDWAFIQYGPQGADEWMRRHGSQKEPAADPTEEAAGPE
jgi:hypothetical protein